MEAELYICQLKQATDPDETERQLTNAITTGAMP